MRLRKLKKYWWFAKHPSLYRHLLHNVSQKIFVVRSPFEDTREEANSWCARVAISGATAVERICGAPAGPPVHARFENALSAARRAAESCPVRMGGSADLDLLFGLAEGCAATKVVETGVAYGWSSLILLLSLRQRPGSRLISTDKPYPMRNNDPYVACVVPLDLRHNWIILRYADRQAIPEALKRIGGTIDLCHYDSDKSYAGRMWAYPRLWKALRPGGVFVSDDVGDNLAFRHFAASVHKVPVVVKSTDKYVGILIKEERGSGRRFA